MQTAPWTSQALNNQATEIHIPVRVTMVNGMAAPRSTSIVALACQWQGLEPRRRGQRYDPAQRRIHALKAQTWRGMFATREATSSLAIDLER